MALYIRLRYFAVSDIQKMRYVNNQVRKQNFFGYESKYTDFSTGTIIS